eukprot:8521186-Pyramimonas_sp.AAC.1
MAHAPGLTLTRPLIRMTKKEGEEQKEEDEQKEAEEKPIVEIPLTGKVEEEVAALYNLNTGLAPPPGSIWSRNQELYGGNQKMPSLEGYSRPNNNVANRPADRSV